MADGVMKKVFVIGIGAGNPDDATVQAINALNEVDVFFVMDKGKEKEELVRLRKEIRDRYIQNKSYRTIEAPDPPRDRHSASYEASVDSWHEQRTALYEQLIGKELSDDECGAFSVWGDPSLYDSTLRIIETDHRKRAVTFEYEVIPGINSIQALRLTSGASDAGDALLLGDGFSRMPLDRIAALFGDSFAQGVAQSAPGVWVGPLRSGYGLHLVLVTAVEPGKLPPFERLRSAVEREWFAERRAAVQAAQYESLLAGYRVIVQKPAAAP